MQAVDRCAFFNKQPYVDVFFCHQLINLVSRVGSDHLALGNSKVHLGPFGIAQVKLFFKVSPQPTSLSTKLKLFFNLFCKIAHDGRQNE